MKRMSNWLTVEESSFAWEREALDFVRQHLPNQDPYYAWSNFEFIALDGSLNEVDLLVFSPQGFFLIEIKSRPGYLRGDAGTWVWEHEGRAYTMDNPLSLANRKAKRLKSLLEAQASFQKRERPPYIEALVFCSAPHLQCELQGTAKYNVCLRDRAQVPGIMAAIIERHCPGLRSAAIGSHDSQMLRRLQQAMEQAGIRRSQRYKQVGDYKLGSALEQTIGYTDNYQDWAATHVQFPQTRRWIRIYPVRSGAIAEDRQMMQRAAEREFRLLEELRHSGIVRCEHFMTHELGPALFFEHDPAALRLDHYLIQYANQLDTQVRVNLLRQLAETMQFSHAHQIFHRALCPQSILVTGVTQPQPQTKIFNWQVAYQEGGSTTGQKTQVTTHIDRLVADSSTAYVAPEALSNPHLVGEYLDIFSLGAIAYFLFSGVPPAANGLELSEKLRHTQGLQISAVLNGAATSLQYLIATSTQSSVKARYASVTDFLADLDDVEAELTRSEPIPIQHPADANQGAILPGKLEVLQRLGRGGCAVGLLVKRDEQMFILKVASDTTFNDRVLAEADVLEKLRHPRIVEFCDRVQIGEWCGFLMKPIFVQRDKEAKNAIETLRQRLRREKTLQLDLLQRLGEDLLEAVNYLEEVGYAHRDIKPDNIAVGQVGANNQLHLNLFDFSLTSTPIHNIRAGTTGYLDPFLPLRDPPCWDSAAERYAVAITLYEMATGDLPKWGDGVSDPSHLDCEVTLDAEKFTQWRDRFLDFFQQALRRDPSERFANAAEMLAQWRACFQAGTASASEGFSWERLQERLETIDLQTPLQALASLLEAPLLEALDRVHILTVQDLRDASPQQLTRLRGVVNQRRRDITELARLVRQRFTNPADTEPDVPETNEIARLSIDLLAQRVQANPKDGETDQGVIERLLGLANGESEFWPSQDAIAQQVAASATRIGQVVEKFQKRWYRLQIVKKLRDDVLELLTKAGGVMTIAELAQSLLVARGSKEEKRQRRQQLAIAVVRVAVEAEQMLAQPRFATYSRDARRVIALTETLANYAFALGDCADELAQADPLLAPARSLAALQAIAPSEPIEPLSATRLVGLAAAASTGAALSSRQEFYPQNLAAERALKLSQGALHGARSLSIEQIQARVASRYPAAAPLPSRPHLDQLLAAAGLELRWDDTEKVYALNWPGISSSSRGWFSSTTGQVDLAALSAENLALEQFEARLQRSLRDRAFLTLTTTPADYLSTAAALCARFGVQRWDFEGIFLDQLREVAQAARVDWELVLQTDAQPHTGDWDKLLLLVGRTMKLVEAQFFSMTQPGLLIFPAMLARYNQMTFLETLRDRVGQGDTLPGLWLLVVGSRDRALISGQAVPLISPGQRVPVPRAWLQAVTHQQS